MVLDEGGTSLFGGDARMGVREGAVIGMAGTEANPVVLTSTTEQRGSWRGLLITDSAAILNHARIMWGGSATSLFRGTLYFSDIYDDQRIKQLDNVFIDGSAHCGLVIEHEDLGLFDPFNVTYGSNNEENFCRR